MGRLIDIENIDYVRLEDSLHCLEHHKGDEVECVICAPTVEAIPKDQYEARLKADMVAMLTDMKDELKHCEITGLWKANYREGFNDGVSKSLDAIQQKINELKAESEDKE